MALKGLLSRLGLNIREARNAYGLSQEQLAAQAGLDRAYLGRVERGEANISAINLAKLACTLGVEVAALFPPLSELAAKDHKAARTRNR